MPVSDTIFEVQGMRLSAKSTSPEKGMPLATVVALPGGGYTSEYWHHRHCPSASLLTIGADLGYRVIALDRPGYGASARPDGGGVVLDDQVALIGELIGQLAAGDRAGKGVFLIGHSMGGILSLMVAAQSGFENILGVDVSGVPRTFSERLANSMAAVIRGEPNAPEATPAPILFYGPTGTYPAQLADQIDPAAAPCPLTELEDSYRWPGQFEQVAGKITVPVQYTLGEHETVTKCDLATLNETGRLFGASSRVAVYLQPGAGHNVSLHHVGRAYHLRALAFFDEILARG
ncbi:MAG: thioesterase [Sphingomonadales bacterium]|nr:thioesterase [Sphingomonadales bacterium]